MYIAMEHYPPVSKWTLTWALTIQHTDTDIQGKKSTFFQDHQNSDHWKQWHTGTQRKKTTFFQDHQNSTSTQYTETQGKKPTFFQDHLNPNRLSPQSQKLRSLIQHMSSIQDMNTADPQKPIKLSFSTHLFIMMIETLSGTILSMNFHLTLSS